MQENPRLQGQKKGQNDLTYGGLVFHNRHLDHEIRSKLGFDPLRDPKWKYQTAVRGALEEQGKLLDCLMKHERTPNVPHPNQYFDRVCDGPCCFEATTWRLRLAQAMGPIILSPPELADRMRNLREDQFGYMECLGKLLSDPQTTKQSQPLDVTPCAAHRQRAEGPMLPYEALLLDLSKAVQKENDEYLDKPEMAPCKSIFEKLLYPNISTETRKWLREQFANCQLRFGVCREAWQAIEKCWVTNGGGSAKCPQEVESLLECAWKNKMARFERAHQLHSNLFAPSNPEKNVANRL